MSEKKDQNRRYTDEQVKWAGIGAGAALGSAALAAAVLYATRAKAKTPPVSQTPDGNVPTAPKVEKS